MANLTGKHPTPMETHIADPVERSRASVRRWYANNREQYSELRRKRYKSDPKLRAKARKRAAVYRKMKAAGKIRVTRTLTRELNGQQVEVFTSGYVSERVKFSPQILASWERRGWLPPPIFENEHHRLYTARQVALIKLLADAVRPKLGTRKIKDPEVLEQVLGLIRKTWTGVDNAGESGQQKGQKARRRSRRG